MKTEVMTGLERRQNIINLLSVRRFETTANLAFEFGVSVKTIFRDIDELSNHYPIYTVTGKGGGVYMADGYRTGMKFLSDKQEAELRELMESVSGQKKEILKSILDNFSLTEIKNRKHPKRL